MWTIAYTNQTLNGPFQADRFKLVCFTTVICRQRNVFDDSAQRSMDVSIVPECVVSIRLIFPLIWKSRVLLGIPMVRANGS